MQSPSLNNRRGRVLCKGEKDRHTRCEVLARSKRANVSVQAAQRKRVSGSAGNIPSCLQEVYRMLGPLCDILVVLHHLSHPSQALSSRTPECRVGRGKLACDESGGRVHQLLAPQLCFAFAQTTQATQQGSKYVCLQHFQKLPSLGSFQSLGEMVENLSLCFSATRGNILPKTRILWSTTETPRGRGAAVTSQSLPPTPLGSMSGNARSG